jgi:hypothetical protein
MNQSYFISFALIINVYICMCNTYFNYAWVLSVKRYIENLFGIVICVFWWIWNQENELIFTLIFEYWMNDKSAWHYRTFFKFLFRFSYVSTTYICQAFNYVSLISEILNLQCLYLSIYKLTFIIQSVTFRST